MKYNVSSCPRCNFIQSSGMGTFFTCKKCNKQTKYRKADGMAKVKVFKIFDNPFDAVYFCQALKKEVHKPLKDNNRK